MTLQEKFKTCFNELTPGYTKIKLYEERIWDCRQERAKLEEDLRVAEYTLVDANCATIDELTFKIEACTLQINALTGINSQQYQKRAACSKWL